MSPNTHYRERSTLRAVRNDPQFKLVQSANGYLVHGIPLQDGEDGKYVVEFVNSWKLDFGRPRTCRDWTSYMSERDHKDFGPATAPQLCALIDTLEQNRKHPAYGQVIAGIRSSFPVSTQFATTSFVQYLPSREIVHHQHGSRDFKIEEHIAGASAYLTENAPNLGAKCKALLGTRDAGRVNAAFKWLTDQDIALMLREKTPKYETRFVTFGNRQVFEGADHYMIDADCAPAEKLNAIAFKIVDRIA